MTALAFSIFPMMVPAIERARRLGHRIICIHHNASRREYALRYVDEFYHVPAYKPEDKRPEHHRKYINLNRVIEIAKQEHVDYLLPSPCGSEAIEIGLINEALGTPGLNFQQSQICVDKILWNRFLQTHSLPWVPWRPLTKQDFEHDLESFRDFPFPAVIKPDQGTHSLLTQSLESFEDLQLFFDELGGFEIHPYGRMLLQQHLPGQHILTELVCHSGEIRFLSTRDILTDRFPCDIGYGSTLPSSISESQQREVLKLVKAVVTRLRIDHAVLSLDIIFDAQQRPVCIDANPRPSGSGPEMIRLAYGFDYIEALIRLRSGEALDFPNRPEASSAYQLLRLPPGKLNAVQLPPPEKFDVIFHNGSFFQQTAPGAEIEKLRNISNNRERIYAAGYSPTAALNRIQNYINHIKLDYEPVP